MLNRSSVQNVARTQQPFPEEHHFSESCLDHREGKIIDLLYMAAYLRALWVKFLSYLKGH